ncbi:MAG: symmetrical bis(5'-nucleosyl)-tetraphosphatase [Gammaproteobacteria bacterium]
MATYAIGDLQGCDDELTALLSKIRFTADKDQLWFVGDLVNRGPKSLQTLRHVRALRENSIVVLGNHDLHLLSCRYLDRMSPTKKDTTQEILDAADCDDLLDWLRQQRLAHFDPSLNFAMVHAGLPPTWDVKNTVSYAQEVEHVLQSESYVDLLENMYGNEPTRWDDSLEQWPRLRFIVNALTRLRFSNADGGIDMQYKGPLGSQPQTLKPWFQLSKRPSDERVVFGHWSSLRLSKAEQHKYAVYPIDTGAVWGGRLSALRLEDLTSFSVASSVAVPIK